MPVSFRYQGKILQKRRVTSMKTKDKFFKIKACFESVGCFYKYNLRSVTIIADGKRKVLFGR